MPRLPPGSYNVDAGVDVRPMSLEAIADPTQASTYEGQALCFDRLIRGGVHNSLQSQARFDDAQVLVGSVWRSKA